MPFAGVALSLVPLWPLLGLVTPPVPGDVDLVVTAAPPLDAQRLADAVRAYLDEYGIRVESAVAAAPGDLRRQLADARGIGEAVRAMAVVRAQSGARGTIEIQLVDLATEKILIAEVPRPPRDEDLYRALALKIQASLRATLSEAPERLDPGSGLIRLASSPAGSAAESVSSAPGGPASSPAAARFSLETGYLVIGSPFTGAGPALQGLTVVAAFAPRPWLEVTLGTAGLGSARAEAGGVVAVATVLPLFAAARLRLAARHAEALVGPAAALAYVAIAPSSTSVAVRPTRDLDPALGLEVEGRLRAGASVWLYARARALGVLAGERYRAQGQLLFDTSGAQVSASAGVGIGLP